MEYILDEKVVNLTKVKPIKYIINNECWECISHCKIKSGYVIIKRNYKSIYMHRYVYELHNGEISNGLHVLHKCDNRSCINPKHLFLGTHQDNMEDKKIKGRSNSGRNGGRKKVLSKEELLEIKSMLIKKIKSEEIAKLFNVSGPTISKIKNGKSPYTKELNGWFL